MLKKRYFLAGIVSAVLLGEMGVQPFNKLLWTQDTIWRSDAQLALPSKEKLLILIHERKMETARSFWGWIAIDSIPMREMGNNLSVFLLDIPSQHVSVIYDVTDNEGLNDADGINRLGWSKNRFCASLRYNAKNWVCGNLKGEPLEFLTSPPEGLTTPKWNSNFPWHPKDIAVLDYTTLHNDKTDTSIVWVYRKSTRAWQAAMRWVGSHENIAFFPKEAPPPILSVIPYPGQIPNQWKGHKRGWNFFDAQITEEAEKIDAWAQCASDHPGVFDSQNPNIIYAPHGAYWQKNATIEDAPALRKRLSPESYQTRVEILLIPGDAGVLMINLPAFGYAAFQIKTLADTYPGNPCSAYYNSQTKAYEGLTFMGEYTLFSE